MPQFDYTTYASQIFWFIICFSILYLTVYFVIIPRLSHIINTRAKIISSNNAIAEELQQEITKISQESKQLRTKAQNSYQESINQAIKEINKNRENSLVTIKTEINILQKEAQKKIQEFFKQSFVQNQQQITDIANLIKNKIFSSL
jgi:F-type H+-transporting ATPase subunit b